MIDANPYIMWRKDRLYCAVCRESCDEIGDKMGLNVEESKFVRNHSFCKPEWDTRSYE